MRGHTGMPLSKTWRIVTTCSELHDALARRSDCAHLEHAPCEGVDTHASGRYPVHMAVVVHNAVRMWHLARVTGSAMVARPVADRKNLCQQVLDMLPTAMLPLSRTRTNVYASE
eukprot:4526264-Amphidinium_carterae.1